MPEPRIINVLVVEDSGVARDLLIHILTSDPAIRIVGTATNGEEAIAALTLAKPDVVTMDIHMPKMDGLEATRRIMETEPVPIVIVSASFDAGDVQKTFRAMEAGAVAAMEKPPGMRDPDFQKYTRRLIDTVKAMSEVRVIKRWKRARAAAPQPVTARTVIETPRAETSTIRIVAIGASTGGPPVIDTILSALAKPFPLPILIVQHISAGFVQGLAEWLSQKVGMPVRIAQHGERVVSGNAYLAPDGCQMRMETAERISCGAEEAENGLRPAVSCLFRSVAKVFGGNAAGILLTGMGKDGAEELKVMRAAGAVTFAQDKESSIVHGMPGEAIRIGAAVYVLPPAEIAATLQALVSRGKNTSASSP